MWLFYIDIYVIFNMFYYYYNNNKLLMYYNVSRMKII